MLKITPVEFFLRTIPETLIFMWGIFVILKRPVKDKNYAISVLLMSLLTYVVRALPINYGVHVVINNVITVALLITLLKESIVRSIYSTFILTILLATSEFVNVFILTALKVNMETAFSTPLAKCISGIPSLLFIITVIFLIKLLFIKKEGRLVVSE